ncbi:hypothetical protein BS17DRAFT_729802 [Gyrodon lividus]|nr:hypothetical protein BS17DRAFT_729802 [Gyrodon lividus]
MHQCEQCKKEFPRPSGLATHMNSHSGAKPYKCSVPNCDRSFAVRSNARRHLRTHGINPSYDNAPSGPSFTVDFEEPLVTHVHDSGRQPSRYRWIAQTSSQQNNWPRLESSSTAVEGSLRAGSTFQVTLSPVVSSTQSNISDDDCDERASLLDPEPHQYQGEHNGDSDEFSGIYPDH